MPEYGTSAFLANPIEFMKTNVVLTLDKLFNGDQYESGMYEMCLVRYAPETNVKGRKDGKNVPVYRLKRWIDGEDPINKGFSAYWCPYADNNTLTCMLGNDALYMFTPTMTGCSFGVGSQSYGVCRVAHANMKKVGNELSGQNSIEESRAQMRLAQKIVIGSTLGAKAKIIDPLQYRLDQDNSQTLNGTTFGIHEVGESWKFYTQAYLKMGKTFCLREVKDQI